MSRECPDCRGAGTVLRAGRGAGWYSDDAEESDCDACGGTGEVPDVERPTFAVRDTIPCEAPTEPSIAYFPDLDDTGTDS